MQPPRKKFHPSETPDAQSLDDEEPLPGHSLKVRDLLQTGNARLQGEYHFEDIQGEGDFFCDWHIRRSTVGLDVTGNLTGTVILECARCLEPFSVPIEVRIDERYVFQSYVDPYEREKELKAEDFFEVVDEEGVLDLKDLVHQFIILEAENRSTCERPECAYVAS